MRNMVCLRHQSLYFQAPGLFPEIRWFFLLCGYGSGKTMADVLHILYDVKRLQGKKDAAGNYARLMVCGYTLSHLEKTLLIYLRQLLDTSKTVYVENKKYNTIKIGTVTIILQQLENPGEIFGIDVHKAYVEEADELTTDKMLEAAKSLNERCRQVLAGERGPAICLASTSQGHKGLYALYCHFKKSGVGFVLIRGRTEDNPFLPKALIQDMYKAYTKEEREVFMHGQFLSIAKGRVIPGFDWARNYIEYDLDMDVKPGETVYWSNDINCIAEGEKVHTLRGDIPIESVLAGDLVLTRKGYRKVLNVFNNGLNIVSRCSTLYSTNGHIFRTPEGDKPQWEIKKNGSIYYLPKHESFCRRIEKMAEEVVLLVRELSSLGSCTIESQDTKDRLENILLIQKNVKCFMSLFGNIITVLCRKGVKYTILMVLMIIDLKRLYACLRKYIQPFIRETGFGKIRNGQNVQQKRQTRLFEHGIKVKKDSDIIVINRKRIGLMGFLFVGVSAIYAVTNLLRKSLQQGFVRQSVSEEELISEEKRLEGVIGSMSTVVRNVEERLKVLKMRYAALENAPHGICGIVVRGAGGSDEEFSTRVYDLEVEDAHEYFVNGTLVHNTGFNRGSAYIVREGIIYCVKFYDFPDLHDAPKVVRYDFPEQRILWLPDVTIKDSFPSFAKDLRQQDIKIIYRKKSPLVEDTCFLVSKLFYMGRLMVCKIAKNVAEACALAMRDKDNKIPKGWAHQVLFMRSMEYVMPVRLS